MYSQTFFRKTTLAIIIAAFSPTLFASGFQLQESSASGLGRAFSGEGVIADNAASGNRNPASMTMFDRPTFSGGVIYVAPAVKIMGTSPAGSDMYVNDITPNEWIPNLHFIYPINDRWALGTSLTTNYGLSTKFSDDYVAGALGGETKLTTGNVNFSAAYRLNEQFSVGAGFNAVYAKAKINRYAGENANGFPANTNVAHLQGDEWGYGWNAGLMYEFNQDHRIGLSYRSKISIDFTGDYRSDIPSGYNPIQSLSGMPWGTDGKTVKGDLTLDLPEIWEISGFHKVAPKWAMHYTLAYTHWDQFKELKGTHADGHTLFYKHEGFSDAYRFAIGTTYYHSQTWTWRAGIAIDESAVPSSNRSISIPDQHRVWLSVGTTWHFNQDASIDMGVSYMHGKKVKIEEKLNNAPNSPIYHFDSEGKAWLFGVNMNYWF